MTKTDAAHRYFIIAIWSCLLGYWLGTQPPHDLANFAARLAIYLIMIFVSWVLVWGLEGPSDGSHKPKGRT